MKRRPGSALLLAYDALRLIPLLWLLQTFTAGIEGYRAAAILAMVLPQVFFPFMALFLLLDRCRYRAYIPLASAGKALSGLLLLVVSVISLPSIIASAGYLLRATLMETGFLAVLGILDLLSLVILRLSAPGDAATDQGQGAVRRPEPRMIEGVH